MARVLAYTTPARGHLFPVIPILDELLGREHEIALRTLASAPTNTAIRRHCDEQLMAKSLLLGDEVNPPDSPD